MLPPLFVQFVTMPSIGELLLELLLALVYQLQLLLIVIIMLLKPTNVLVVKPDFILMLQMLVPLLPELPE